MKAYLGSVAFFVAASVAFASGAAQVTVDLTAGPTPVYFAECGYLNQQRAVTAHASISPSGAARAAPALNFRLTDSDGGSASGWHAIRMHSDGGGGWIAVLNFGPPSNNPLYELAIREAASTTGKLQLFASVRVGGRLAQSRQLEIDTVRCIP